MTVWSPRRQHRQHHDYPFNLWEKGEEVIRQEFARMLGHHGLVEVGVLPDDLQRLFAGVRDFNNRAARDARHFNNRRWMAYQVVLWRGCYGLRRFPRENKHYSYRRATFADEARYAFVSPVTGAEFAGLTTTEHFEAFWGKPRLFDFAAFLRRS